MRKFLLAAILALVATAPASATVIIQTKFTNLASLDTGAISDRVGFKNFAFFDLPNERLVEVYVQVDSFIDGRIFATNSATGGNAASRKRDVGATLTLAVALAGNGFALSGSSSATDARNTVNGNGNVIRLNDLDSSFTLSDSLYSDFGVFENGHVRFDFDASANFAAVAASNVSYADQKVTSGQTFVTLVYFGVVPEPGTWLLLIAGFGAVGVAARRTRRLAVRT